MRAIQIIIMAASVALTGCSFVVSFDRNRVGDGGVRDGGMDAMADAGACDPATHAGCGPNELCCGSTGAPECVAIGTSQCEACATACAADATSACVERACRCGDGAACQGTTPFCDDAAGQCVECRDSSDCTDQQCVGGQCVDCDRSDNSGCMGETPICNASNECEACTEDPDNCPGILVCTPSGACGGCDADTHEGCETRTTPICDSASTLCRGCASATECMTERGRDFCLADGRCTVCDPSDSAGCSGMTPICRAGADGTLACGACTADAECAARAATPVCAESGASAGACVECDAGDESVCAAAGGVCDVDSNTCVDCLTSADCSGDAPICGADRMCRGCMDTPECTAVSAGTVCVTTGAMAGRCGACDPATSTGCSGTTPVCDAASASCVGCTMDAQCSGSVCVTSGAMMGACGACDPTDSGGCGGLTPVCNASLTCVGCTTNAQCTAITAGSFCATSGARMGGCEDCDPMDQEGCTSATAPVCDETTAECRGCSGNPECAGSPSGTVCASTGACGMCNPDGDIPCMGDTPVCDPATLTCVECATNADCTAIDDGYECNAANRCVCGNPMGNRCECGPSGSTTNCMMGQFCVAGECAP